MGNSCASDIFLKLSFFLHLLFHVFLVVLREEVVLPPDVIKVEPCWLAVVTREDPGEQGGLEEEGVENRILNLVAKKKP